MLEPVAKRYATALFEIAQKEGKVEEYDKQAEMLQEVFANKRLRDFLASPKVPPQRKKEIIARHLSASIERGLLNLLKLLIDKHRIGHVLQILRYFDLLTDRHRGVEEVTIVSAVALSDEQARQIIEQVQRFSFFGDLRVKRIVDPGILGGVIVHLGGNAVLDGSVATRLKQMRERLERFRHRGIGA